jgi:outer membrane protein
VRSFIIKKIKVMIAENENTPKRPERLSLILSIVAIIGLIFMIILKVTEDKDNDELLPGQRMPVVSSGTNSIVFVNSDLLLKQYELVNVLTVQLDEERKRKDNDFTAKQKAYEDDAAYFQTQVQKQSISEESAKQIYEKLMLQQQELYSLQDQYTAELSKKEFEMNLVLLDSVKNYLSRLNKIYNYDYVLSSNNTGNILLAKDTFDITNQVLEGLNKEYNEKMNPGK